MGALAANEKVDTVIGKEESEEGLGRKDSRLSTGLV